MDDSMEDMDWDLVMGSMANAAATAAATAAAAALSAQRAVELSARALRMLERRALSHPMWQLPVHIVQGYARNGVRRMYEWQLECLSVPGVLNGENLVYCAPTSGGKTLVAELLMIRRVRAAIRSGGKALLVLPFVSMVTEKVAYLKHLCRSDHDPRALLTTPSPTGALSACHAFWSISARVSAQMVCLGWTESG